MIFKDDRLNSYKYNPSCEIKDDKYEDDREKTDQRRGHIPAGSR